MRVCVRAIMIHLKWGDIDSFQFKLKKPKQSSNNNKYLLLTKENHLQPTYSHTFTHAHTHLMLFKQLPVTFTKANAVTLLRCWTLHTFRDVIINSVVDCLVDWLVLNILLEFFFWNSLFSHWVAFPDFEVVVIHCAAVVVVNKHC